MNEKVVNTILTNFGLKNDGKSTSYYYENSSKCLIWLFPTMGGCRVVKDLYIIGGNLVTMTFETFFYDDFNEAAIQQITKIMKKYKELLVEIKKNELEKDFDDDR